MAIAEATTEQTQTPEGGYALQKGEAIEQYEARLNTIPEPNRLMLRTARLLAQAIKAGVYHSGTDDKLEKAIGKIDTALRYYDHWAATSSNQSAVTQATRHIDDEKFDAAMQYGNFNASPAQRNLLKQQLRGLSPRAASDMVLSSAESKAIETMNTATTEAWRIVKEAAGFKPDDNTPMKKIVKAFYEAPDPAKPSHITASPTSELVENLYSLRELCRGAKHK